MCAALETMIRDCCDQICNKTKLDSIGPQDEVGSGGQGILEGSRGSRGGLSGSQGVKG